MRAAGEGRLAASGDVPDRRASAWSGDRPRARAPGFSSCARRRRAATRCCGRSRSAARSRSSIAPVIPAGLHHLDAGPPADGAGRGDRARDVDLRWRPRRQDARDRGARGHRDRRAGARSPRRRQAREPPAAADQPSVTLGDATTRARARRVLPAARRAAHRAGRRPSAVRARPAADRQRPLDAGQDHDRVHRRALDHAGHRDPRLRQRAAAAAQRGDRALDPLPRPRDRAHLARRDELHHPPPWVVAFAFGLLHGFGFASGLSTLGLPRAEIPLALLLFNVGVELGQLAFVALVLLLARSFRTLEIRWPRWAEALPGYAVGGLGAFWTIQRAGRAVRRRGMTARGARRGGAPTGDRRSSHRGRHSAGRSPTTSRGRRSAFSLVCAPGLGPRPRAGDDRGRSLGRAARHAGALDTAGDLPAIALAWRRLVQFWYCCERDQDTHIELPEDVMAASWTPAAAAGRPCGPSRRRASCSRLPTWCEARCTRWRWPATAWCAPMPRRPARVRARHGHPGGRDVHGQGAAAADTRRRSARWACRRATTRWPASTTPTWCWPSATTSSSTPPSTGTRAATRRSSASTRSRRRSTSTSCPRSSWWATSTTSSPGSARSAGTCRTRAGRPAARPGAGPLRAAKDDDDFPVHPPRALYEIRQALGREDILISDVGLHKLWIGRMFPAYEPNTVLIANGLAGMGFALPAAIAAKLVHPRQQRGHRERRRRLPDELPGARDRRAPRRPRS